MASTWEAIYRDSLSLAGILGEDQELDPTMLANASTRARNLIDELDGEGIALPVLNVDVEFNTVPGQSRYVLGIGDDPTPANPIRPELIINGQIQIQSGEQPVYLDLDEITFPEYRRIAVPKNLSQPFQYAFNPAWPQGEMYLWPTPSSEWLIRFTTKVRWVDTVGNPNADITAQAQLPSGFTNAFTNMLAYKLAYWRRIQTPGLLDAYRQGKYVMMAATWRQNADKRKGPATAFPWNITQSRMNP